ncbi:hypothetical protein [Pedobacter sp. R-06]|uniref:hypothetical protein n=1 Tax=Pedobacter sp. R-06 TaxID=3404051 RepID=UPI003CE89044
MKILYIVPIIVLLVFLYYLISKEGMAKVEDQLPGKFAQYQLIDSSGTIKGGNAQMSLLLESKRNIELFLTSENNVIVSGFSGERENSFIKISADGNVADTLKLMSRPEDIVFLKGFIVDKQAHQYYRWSFNGAKTPIRIIAQNSGFDWDGEKQHKQLANIAKQSKAVYVDYNFNSPLPQKKVGDGPQTMQGVFTYAIVTYIICDECFQFYTTEDIHKYFSMSYLQEMLWNNLFKQTAKQNGPDGEMIRTANIRYQYFQRLKLEKVRFSGGGGNAPGFTKMLYPGYLFTNVIFKNDTLKLKEFMYLDEESHTSSVEIDGKNIGTLSKNKVQPVEPINAYMYYTNDNLQYALFTNNDQKLYLIK